MNRAFFTICLLSFVATASIAKTSEMDSEDLPDPGSTRLGSPKVTIEMNLESRRPMVGLMINGKGPFQFVVDTGAGLSVIDAGIAKELGLEVVGKQTLHSPGATEDIQGERVQVSVLEVGELRIENPVLATMDLVGFSAGTIEGVLGRPHFGELLLTFDYPGSRLVVEKGSLDRSDPAVIEFDPNAGSIQVPIDVSGVTVPMVVDTGSPEVSVGSFSRDRCAERNFR